MVNYCCVCDSGMRALFRAGVLLCEGLFCFSIFASEGNCPNTLIATKSVATATFILFLKVRFEVLQVQKHIKYYNDLKY